MQINQENWREGRSSLQGNCEKQITAVTRKEQKKSPQREDVGQDLGKTGKTQKVQGKKS